MGVYIPNVEMPKNCFQCSFNDGIYCALIDNDTDAFISEDPTKVLTKRLDNCPLIEIVRCGECKFFDYDDGVCRRPKKLSFIAEPTDFCSYGERRE